jgi:hypothetical protein
MVMIDSMSKYCCWWFEVGLSEVFSQADSFIFVSFSKLDAYFQCRWVILSSMSDLCCIWQTTRHFQFNETDTQLWKNHLWLINHILINARVIQSNKHDICHHLYQLKHENGDQYQLKTMTTIFW